jgi:hypothetical protein
VVEGACVTPQRMTERPRLQRVRAETTEDHRGAEKQKNWLTQRRKDAKRLRQRPGQSLRALSAHLDMEYMKRRFREETGGDHGVQDLADQT